MNLIQACLLIVLLNLLTSSCSERQDMIFQLDGSTLSFMEVDSIILYAMEQAQVPGLQMAIFNDHKVRYMKSYGFIDSLKTLPVNNQTVIQSASLSKSMLACIVMRLVEDGRFDLDKPVYQYLDYPLYEMKNSRFDYLDLKEDERYKKITGRMLLSHTAGFKNYRTREGLKIYFEPGTQYHYSGEGILILQGIIEHVTKSGLETLSEEYLFNPLNMDRTSFIWKEDFQNNASFGFKRDGSLHNERKDTVAMAAYSGLTCVTDLSKLIDALLNNSLLKVETKELMLGAQHRIRSKNQFGADALVMDSNNTQAEVQLSYGLGWGHLETPHGPAFFKEGKNPGAQNMCVIFNNGTGLIIMTNSDRGEQLFQYLNEKVIGNSYFPWQWESIFPFYVYELYDVLDAELANGASGEEIAEKYKQYNQNQNASEYSAMILGSLGQELIADKQYDRAIEILNMNIEWNPKSYDACNILAKAYISAGDTTKAIECYEKSLAIKPKGSLALEQLKVIKSDSTS